MGVLVRGHGHARRLDEVPQRDARRVRPASARTRPPSTTPAPSIPQHHRPARGRKARAATADQLRQGLGKPPAQRAAHHARWVPIGSASTSRKATPSSRCAPPGPGLASDSIGALRALLARRGRPNPRQGRCGVGLAHRRGDRRAQGGKVSASERAPAARRSSCASTPPKNPSARTTELLRSAGPGWALTTLTRLSRRRCSDRRDRWCRPKRARDPGAGPVRRLHRFLRESSRSRGGRSRPTKSQHGRHVGPRPRAPRRAARRRALRLERRGAGGRCAPHGRPSEARVVSDYMDATFDDLRACCPSSRRSSPGPATWPSGRGWRTGARVVRGPKRELISRAYNRRLTPTKWRCEERFSDAQCGFRPSRSEALAGLMRECATTVVLRNRAARDRTATAG